MFWKRLLFHLSVPIPSRQVTDVFPTELPVWLGTGRRRLPRAHLRYPGQLHRHHLRQGHLYHVANRRGRANAVEGQVERQPSFLLLLCTRQLDVEHGVRLLRRREEVRPRVLGGESCRG